MKDKDAREQIEEIKKELGRFIDKILETGIISEKYYTGHYRMYNAENIKEILCAICDYLGVEFCRTSAIPSRIVIKKITNKSK